MHDSDPGALFDHVGTELGTRGLACLHLVMPRADQSSGVNALDPNAPARLRQRLTARSSPRSGVRTAQVQRWLFGVRCTYLLPEGEGKA